MKIANSGKVIKELFFLSQDGLPGGPISPKCRRGW